MSSPARMFLFKLARVLGKTVAWIERNMSSKEFAEWWECYKLEPFGDDWRQASLVAVSNLQPWTKRQLENDRFVPRYRPRKTPEELEKLMQPFARMHNRIARKKVNGGNRQSRRDDLGELGSVPAGTSRPPERG